jgi:hypothetical protein
MPRKFPHQTPRFGTKQAPKPDYHWQDNFYYLWWSYLKRNKSYLKSCENGGEGEFAGLYKDFGDVRGDNFKEWWLKDGRGARLFAEPSLPEKERILRPGDEVPPEESSFTVTFPLYLSKRFMLRSFSSMLKQLKHHEGKIGYQDSKRSKAKYQVLGNPTVASLKLGLLIYDMKRSKPNLRLWQIGNMLDEVAPNAHFVEDESKKNRGFFTEQKNILNAAVSRYLKKVQRTIENVGQGIFP